MNGALKWGLMLLIAAALVLVVMPDEAGVAYLLGLAGLVSLLIGVIRIPTRRSRD